MPHCYRIPLENKEQFTGSSKAYAATLAEQLITKKYTGGGIRDYIQEMSHMANKLATMDMPLPELFLVQLVFKSLPKEFATFHVNYNIFPENWDNDKLIVMCVQEEGRLENANGGGELVFQVQHQKKKNPKRNTRTTRGPSRQARISMKVVLPNHLHANLIGQHSQLLKISASNATKKSTTRGNAQNF